jgi:hypothetical protein
MFHEDQSRIWVGNVDQNMVTPYRHEHGAPGASKGSMRVTRMQAGWDNDYLHTVLGL